MAILKTVRLDKELQPGRTVGLPPVRRGDVTDVHRHCRKTSGVGWRFGLSSRYRFAQCQVEEEGRCHPFVVGTLRGMKITYQIVDLFPGRDSRGDGTFPRGREGARV